MWSVQEVQGAAAYLSTCLLTEYSMLIAEISPTGVSAIIVCASCLDLLTLLLSGEFRTDPAHGTRSVGQHSAYPR